MSKRRVLLVQLPIPPAGPAPVRGNVPLAGAYLKMYAELRGLGERYDIEILPTAEANNFGDAALVEAIAAREPWLVGFTCYLWNIDRTLWIVEQLKLRRPEILVLVGGPEITGDNRWTLEHPAVDFAAVGEGEQTFAELLAALATIDQHILAPQRKRGGMATDDQCMSPRLRVGASIEWPDSLRSIAGLHISGMTAPPVFRKPLPHLNEISSPYLCGILDAADEQMLLLETIRGCVYKCKFCYYPKSYDDLYYVAEEKIVANLRHARERGAREVVLLDPTLNQGRNFDKFVELLARENPERQFTYFGELRAEGIKESTAKLLKQANFTEVEIGLQSIDPLAMDLMDRKNNMKAFERGVRALLDVGIDVKVDLIIGLPGDTVDSVRRGLDYLHANRFFSSIQVFNLAILPGTAFRSEAEQLGLQYQQRTPYYVLRTPTLDLPTMSELMTEAQEMFDIEFDPWEDPVLEFAPESVWDSGESAGGSGQAAGDTTLPSPLAGEGPGVRGPNDQQTLLKCWRVACDKSLQRMAPPAEQMAQAFTVWLRGDDLHARRKEAAAVVAEAVRLNPHGTFQIVVEPSGDLRRATQELLETLLRAALETTSYLDRFYAVMPGRPKGAKRLIVVVPHAERETLGRDWADALGELATIVWRGAPLSAPLADLDHYELFAPPAVAALP
ncbi:MAG: radical SAM protein [Planctomycetales bacterium]|nr:radical SAM protein [Planctomycetales bacterium]